MPSNLSNPSSHKRILVCATGLVQYLEDQIQMGIRRFAYTHPNWHIKTFYAKNLDAQALKEIKKWKPDGILIVSRLPQALELLTLENIPRIVAGFDHDLPDEVNHVAIDNSAIGARAADYFIRNRYQHFAVVGLTHRRSYSEDRKAGFCSLLKKERFTPFVFDVETPSEAFWHRDPEMRSWLEALPKPIGIYCVMDPVTLQILEQARDLDLRIPGQISLLGTDNNRILCETTRPHLSSIPQPLEQAGYRAAEVLDAHMALNAAGKPIPIVNELIEPGEVVERQSTSLRAIPDPHIASAAHYMQEHTMDTDCIPEAARAAGMNRRSMERGFSKHLGISPGTFISNLKITHAKRLLNQTDLSMGDIAESCQMTQDHFATFFRKKTGQTPSGYRKDKRS